MIEKTMKESIAKYKIVKYGQWWYGILNTETNMMLRVGPNADYTKPLDNAENKLLLFKSKDKAQEYIDNTLLDEKLIQSSSHKALQQNIKTEIDSGKSPKQAAAIAYSIQRKNESMNLEEELSLSELVKDSINHLVNDLGKDSDAEDFADDVINDIENNYDVDVDFSDPLKYKNWASEVACEVSRQLNEAVRGKDLNEDKQELLRSMAYEDVEYDQVFDKDDFDTFREIMADQGYQISEQDLEDYYEYVKEAQTELNYKDASEDELRKMGAFDNLNLDESAETKICVICNHEYNGYGNNAEPVAKGYCCDKCNIEKVVPARLSHVNESLDTAREKAQELRKHSDADVILYAYRDKKGNLVELEPEELTMDEYQERVKQITDEQTKISDKDPRGNRYGYQKDMMFYALYKGTVTESVSVEPKDNGYHDLWELSDRYAVHNDGGRFYVFDRDNGNNHLFISDSIDEVNNYIKDELKLDVVIEPSTRVFKKKAKVGGKEVAKQQAIKEMAGLDFEVGHTFDPDDFDYFKKVCKEDGWNVTEDDFAKYFEYLDEIRSEQYYLDEAILTDEEKFEREIEQLDIKATNFEKLSRESFDKGNEEGGYYYKELADEIRREIDMKLATRSQSIEEDMNGEYVVMGVTDNGERKYYNADLRDWFDVAEQGTIFSDMDIARDSWIVITNGGRKLPDGFRRIFVPNYNKQTMNEDWNIGSNKVVPFGSDEHLKLMDLAQKLEDNSPNGYKYEVKTTYEDFGAGMQWTTIICYDKKGDSWQVLNTKEWLDLANGKSVDEVYSDVVDDKYFKDKKKAYDNMNLGELFDSMD